jgi:hypothetical protein
MVDYTKFDITKMFDVNTVIDAVEKNNKTFAGLITDERVRTAAENINAAGCELIRAQITAARAFGSAIKQAVAV